MSGREFGGEDLDAGEVDRNQNNSQDEHAQSESHGDECSEVDIHAGCSVDEATRELGAENRDDAQQRETKELKETAKIDLERLEQDVSAWRLARQFLISDF